ncbi:hypothetical protein E2320_010514 [Naja naja]|nr:hypothetical protein E2320_010514 [Naja naja]
MQLAFPHLAGPNTLPPKKQLHIPASGTCNPRGKEEQNRITRGHSIKEKHSHFFSLYKHPPQIITIILDNGSDPLQGFCKSHFLGRRSLSRKLVQFNFQMVPSIQVKTYKYKSPNLQEAVVAILRFLNKTINKRNVSSLGMRGRDSLVVYTKTYIHVYIKREYKNPEYEKEQKRRKSASYVAAVALVSFLRILDLILKGKAAKVLTE